jgi:hypothetical protein
MSAQDIFCPCKNICMGNIDEITGIEYSFLIQEIGEGKLVEEHIGRLIRNVTDPEQMRQLALEYYVYKCTRFTCGLGAPTLREMLPGCESDVDKGVPALVAFAKANHELAPTNEEIVMYIGEALELPFGEKRLNFIYRDFLTHEVCEEISEDEGVFGDWRKALHLEGDADDNLEVYQYFLETMIDFKRELVKALILLVVLKENFSIREV